MRRGKSNRRAAKQRGGDQSESLLGDIPENVKATEPKIRSGPKRQRKKDDDAAKGARRMSVIAVNLDPDRTLEWDNRQNFIRVSYLDELTPEYLDSLKKYKTEDFADVNPRGSISMTYPMGAEASTDDATKKKSPSSFVYLGVTLAYFLIEMATLYLYKVVKPLGPIILGVLHIIAAIVLTLAIYRNWKKFRLPSVGWTRAILALYSFFLLLYLTAPLWEYLIDKKANTKNMWVALFVILLLDGLYELSFVAVWYSFHGPVTMAGLSAALFLIWIIMNILGMAVGGYIGGIMHAAPKGVEDWNTFMAKGSARLCYVNLFLQGFCIFRSFVDPVFASEWWLEISRNTSAKFTVPFSAIDLHILFNVVIAIGYIIHDVYHVFRFDNYGYWKNIFKGCRGARPPNGNKSYGPYYCPDAYYYNVTGWVLTALFIMQFVFSAFRHRLCCMYYLRVWHKPISFMIWFLFAIHARAAWLLIFPFFQIVDEMIHGWSLLQVDSITPYFHTMTQGNNEIRVATVMKLVLKRRVTCNPGNYCFLRLYYPDSPPEAIPFTIVGGPDGSQMSFNIEINMGRARVATSWFNATHGISGKKVELSDVRVAMFGPFASTPKPMHSYPNVIVVTQGIGVTPAAALVKTVVRDAVQLRLRSFQSVTIFWANSKDKHEYEEAMIRWEGNSIESLFEEYARPAVHRRPRPFWDPDGKMKGMEMKDDVERPVKKKGPLVDCAHPTWMNVIVSGGPRGRFSPAFFYKEMSELRQKYGGNFGVYCCGRALWSQLAEIKSGFEGRGFEFHNETF